jgi:hypothetical protein
MTVPSAGRALPLQIYWIASLGAFLATLILVTQAEADTVIEQQLAALKPCSGLKEELFGASLAIDKLESITLSRTQLDINGDLVTLMLQGSLACETSDAALVKGNASVSINATAHMSLTDCSVAILTITPTRFGGTFASVVEAAWRPVILPKLETETRRMLTQACTDFVTGP